MTVTRYGYWMILVLLVVFVRCAWPVVVERWRQASFTRFDAWVFAGVLAVVAIWTSHERPGYKILADELMLSGTAMGMHYDREATYPLRASDVQGSFQILLGSLDKRPLLYPFLVSTVHDLTGYRTANAFYLNMGLAVVFLWLIYLVGWKAGRSRWAGVALILLFAGLPLLAQQATGGGFELLNLVLILAVTWFTACYLERPDRARLEALVLCGLLLASTRYESVVFLIPVALAAWLGWWRAKKVILSWPLLLSPLFLVLPLLQNRIFSANSSSWEMQSRSVTEPFGVQYLAPNLGHALEFFFDFDGYHANSPIFAALGLICIPFLGLWTVRTLRESPKTDGLSLGYAVSTLGLFGVTAVYMLYFWGTFDDPLISRLSLPVHLLMAVAVAVVGAMWIKKEGGWKIVSLVAVAGLMFTGLPSMSKQAYRTIYAPGVKMQLREDFLAALPDRNVLFIDNDSVFWILQKIPSSPVKQSQVRKDSLIFHLRVHSFQEMYVFQSVNVNDQTGEQVVEPADDLGPDFELETVWEKRVQTLMFARISRITGIKDGDKTVTAGQRFVVPVEKKRTEAEEDTARALYLQNWIKQIP